MPVSLNPEDPSYGAFNDGYKSRSTPLSKRDNKILNYAGRFAKNPEGSQDKIRNVFGMHAPEFWSRAQTLADHPDLSKRRRDKYSQLFSTPGPMKGGAPIYPSKKQFTHGVMW